MNKKTLWIVVGVAILVVLVALVSRKGQVPPTGEQQGATTTGTQSGTPPKGASFRKPSVFTTVTTLAPVAGDEWVIGRVHEIRWSASAEVTGAIALLDAAGKNTVGWVHQSLGPHQTYFPWNTRDIFPTRTSPLKQDVGPGTYTIQLVFDGLVRAQPSAPFSLTK